MEAAIRLYHDAGTLTSVSTLCAEADVNEDTFSRHFDTVEEVLPGFYDLAVDQYQLLIAGTEGYDSFTFEERLASFYYILIDTLDEHRPFVAATFHTAIRTRSRFRNDVRRILGSLLTDAQVPAPNQLLTGLWPVHEVLTEVTFALIRHWIHDESENQSATTALIDKFVGFVAELVTFRGVSRGLDLAWHIYQHDALGLRALPLLGRLFPRSTENRST